MLKINEKSATTGAADITGTADITGAADTSNSFFKRDSEGTIVSPFGMGAGMAGMGALGGLLLSGGDTPWWKKLLYSLMGAGLLGGGGYLAGTYMGDENNRGLRLPGVGKLPSSTVSSKSVVGEAIDALRHGDGSALDSLGK